MLHRVNRRTHRLRHGVFAVSAEDFVEAALQRRGERAIVPCPQPRDSRVPRLLRHFEDLVAFLEVKRKTYGIPAALECPPIFGARGIFKDFDAGNILPKKSQPKGNLAWHAEAPRKSFGRILAKVIVQAEIAVNSSE